jgi:hypothetical protein
VVAADQVRRMRMGAWPVLGTPGRPGRRLAFGHRPAAGAAAGLHPVLGYVRPRRRWRGLEHLPGVHPLHRRIRQFTPAPPATGRRTLDDLVRVGHLPQRRPGRPRLLARLATLPLAQRPIPPLAGRPGIRAIRRRRLTRGRPVPPDLPLKLTDPLNQLRDLPIPLGQRRRMRLIPSRQHLPQPRVVLPLPPQHSPQLPHLKGTGTPRLAHEPP